MPLALQHPTSPFLPLSEDERLVLPASRELVAGTDEPDRIPLGSWDQVTALAHGEKRNISLLLRLKHDVTARMIRVFEVPEGARLTIDQIIEAEGGAEWNGTVIVRGGGEVRLRRTLQVFGPGAKVELNVLALLEHSGRMSVAEEIFCNQVSCEVTIRTRFLLKDTSSGLARARLVIGEQGAETTGSEELHTLALGPEVQIRTIPELEVRNETARCHHAASSLPLDEAASFYLATRGLADSEAEKVLSRGFAQAVLDRVPLDLRSDSERVLFA